MTVKSGKGRGSKDPAPSQAPNVPNVIEAHFPRQVDGSPGMSVSSGDIPRTNVSIAPSSYTVYSGNASFVRLSQKVAPSESERKKDGSPYLLDVCPTICGRTERSQIIPNIPWQVLQEQNVAEWRCWMFIQRWRRFAHAQIRLDFKGRCWGLHGNLLNMYKSRVKGQTHKMDKDFPPGTLPNDGSRERAYPNAKYLDRSKPRPSEDYPLVSMTSRHRIMH